MFKGANVLANAVKATLGPKGRNAVLEKSYGAPTITKDGVSVAKEIELKDKFENMPPGTLSEPSRVCRSRDYFSCISFVTDFTPPTALATLTASLIFSRELTKPLN